MTKSQQPPSSPPAKAMPDAAPTQPSPQKDGTNLKQTRPQPLPQTQLNPQAGEVSIEKGAPARP